MSENNQNEVRKEPHVMSRDDVNDYDGLTLNEQGEQEERSAEDSFIHIYMIHIHELPWWKKLLGGLGIAVFILLGLVLVWLFFIYGAIVLATVAIIYFIRKYLLKYSKTGCQPGIRFHFLIYSIDKKRYNNIGNTFYIMVKNRV